jgi:transcriptional regulator with PAS, ATPase and Fis domain
MCRNEDARQEHLQRAARGFLQVGHISAHRLASLEAGGQDNVDDQLIARALVRSSVRSDGAAPSEAARSAVRAAAAILNANGNPALMGQELQHLVEFAGLASNGVACRGTSDSSGSGRKADQLLTGNSDGAIRIELGEADGLAQNLIVRTDGEASTLITLLAVQQLVSSARALRAAQLAETERSALWPDPLPEQQLGFVCASEAMLDLLRITRRVASSNITVLITGETGTGKELLAKAIHQCSQRSTAAFIPYNCTTVSREMLDSQLFGYRKGAFTGAQDAFPGVIRSAAGGTLFLDEIGEIGLDVQPKLLRFLESSEVHPLGEPAPISVDVRVVAATNADLDRLMAEGKFREDLFYRLNVVKLTIPPLRERREEIPLLLDHFLERTLKEAGKTGVRIAESTSEFLLLYAWPGNVRELANEVRRMVAMAESGSVLMPEHLSPKIAATRRTVPASERPLEPTELVVRRDQPLSAAVEHVERALIQDALRSTSNVELAARKLGLSRKGLYLKRQRLKIDD